MALQNQIRYLFAADTTVADGSGKAGLVYSGITAKYLIDGGTLQSLTTETITTLGTYQAPTSAAHIRIKELAAAEPTKGIYEIHFHDTLFATGTKLWLFLSASGAKFQPLEIDLLAQTGDSYTRIGAAGAGLTALGDTRIANLDATVSSRLATSGYTVPPTAAANASQVRTELTTELGRIDATISSRLASASYTAPDNYTIGVINAWLQDDTYGLPPLLAAVNSRLAEVSYIVPDNTNIGNTYAIVSSVTYGNEALLTAVQAGGGGVGNSGAAILSARVSYSSISPRKGYTEIIQGEEKVITFLVEADGRFDQQVPDSITVTIADPEGNVITKTNSDVERVAEELDIQAFRVTLDTADTNTLVDGLAKIEIKIDTQKAYLTHSMKVIEAIG